MAGRLLHDRQRRLWTTSALWLRRLCSPPASGPSGPPGASIRPRRGRDLGACARLLRLVHAAGQYPVYWPPAPRAWLADGEVLDAWVAERRGELVGHVAICRVGSGHRSALRWREITGHSPDRLAGVSQFFVRPRAQGQGTGSALLAVAVREIRARGLVPVLEVVSASRDAIAMYEARGWRLAGIDDWGRPADRLRLLYYLAPLDPPA